MKTTTISRLTSISLATLMLAGVSVNAIATPATTQPASQLAQATAKKRLVVMDFDYGTTNSYYTSYRGVGAAPRHQRTANQRTRQQWHLYSSRS
jgi:hypothetical protein